MPELSNLPDGQMAVPENENRPVPAQHGHCEQRLHMLAFFLTSVCISWKNLLSGATFAMFREELEMLIQNISFGSDGLWILPLLYTIAASETC